jgi:hypothetical protein
MLRKVAADGGDVADLRRGNFRRGLVQAGKNLPDFRSSCSISATVTSAPMVQLSPPRVRSGSGRAAT